jgi:hypothetical protein
VRCRLTVIGVHIGSISPDLGVRQQCSKVQIPTSREIRRGKSTSADLWVPVASVPHKLCLGQRVQFPVCRHPCKCLSRGNTTLPTRASEERARTTIVRTPARICASRLWFLPSQNRTSICCLQLQGSRHRRLSLCSLPVPKQSGGSLWSDLLRPVGQQRDLAVCALCRPFPVAAAVLGRRAVGLFYGHEVALLAIYPQQIRDHLPSHCKGGPVGVSFLYFLFAQ